jgi:hypothetical protein
MITHHSYFWQTSFYKPIRESSVLQMEGCSLDDAFPSGASASAGCVDTKTSEESRRQEKKRARKCRGPALNYLNSGMNMVGAVDPDRLSKRMEPVPELNDRIGLTVHEPVTQQ